MRQSFSEEVYRVVRKIPKGKVATYGRVAAKLGNPRLVRAVGNALHHNPDPKNIPCHRVVNKSGRLATGYAFGGPKEQKRKLLAEGVEFKDRNHNVKCLYRHFWFFLPPLGKWDFLSQRFTTEKMV